MRNIWFSPGLVVALALSSHAGPAPSKAPSGKKVAVVVNLGDTGLLGSALKGNYDAAVENYKKLGYEVITLTNDSDDKNKWASKKNLEDQLLSLRGKGVEDLKLDIMGHGTLMPKANIPDSEKNRFPVVKFTDPQKAAGSPFIQGKFDDMVWVGLSQTNDVTKKADRKGKDAQLPLIQASLGAGDIRTMLAGFHRSNTTAKTTVHVLNCFGGSLGQELADLRNVQVFTAAESTKTALQYKTTSSSTGKSPCSLGDVVDDLKSTSNYYQDLQAELSTELNPEKKVSEDKRLTYNEIHFKTALTMLDKMIPTDKILSGTADLPRSSAQHFLNRWCSASDHPKSDKTSGGTYSPICNCKVDDLYKTLATVGTVQDLLGKITLPDLLQRINNVSSLAFDRLKKVEDKFCKNDEDAGKLAELMKKQEDEKEKVKKEAEEKLLSASEKDLGDILSKLDFKGAGKAAHESHLDYLKLLKEVNDPILKKGEIPFRSSASIPATHPRKKAIQDAWNAYQEKWKALKTATPGLSELEETARKRQLAAFEKTLNEYRRSGSEERTIKTAERDVENSQPGTYDFSESTLYMLGNLCTFKHDAKNCDQIPEMLKPKGPPRELDPRAKEAMLSIFAIKGGAFANPQNALSDAIAMQCLQAPELQPIQPGENTITDATKLDLPCEKPETTQAQVLYDFNQKSLECVKKHTPLHPYSSYEAAITLTNNIPSLEGRCPYVKAQADLYKSDMECGERFRKEASPTEIEQLINVLRMGDQKP